MQKMLKAVGGLSGGGMGKGKYRKNMAALRGMMGGR